MLTPIEIQAKVFKSGVGYIKKDVDSYISEILGNYENLYKSNVELNDKISMLTEGIQYYKTIEKTLQGALVLAEKTAEDTKTSAKKSAETIINEAHSRAKLIVSDAKNELDVLHNQTIDLIRQYELYKVQYAQLANTQLELLNKDCFNINIAKLQTFSSNYPENQIHDKEVTNLETNIKIENNDFVKEDNNIVDQQCMTEENSGSTDDFFEFIGEQE